MASLVSTTSANWRDLGQLVVFTLLFGSISSLLTSNTAHAADYYLSPSGDDSATGESPLHAWRTLEKASSFAFQPGDRLLLEGGKIFHGTLSFDPEDGGTADAPVEVGSYSAQKESTATINAGDDVGILIEDTTGISIRDLRIVGTGAHSNRKSGIVAYTTTPEGASDLTIENVHVSGFGKHGLSLGAWKTRKGYSNVRITHSRFHDNLRTGIKSWGPWGKGIYAHTRVYIASCQAYRMEGGSGITLSSVDGGIVERCVAHHNGAKFSGAAGIWAWDSNNILFQYNESHHNKTIGVDGDGFDFDGGVTNSIMQYNYSHDNDAAGFLLAQYQHAPQAMRNIILRYNISENDCRKKGYGAIHVWNGDGPDRISNVYIHNNTVYLGPSTGATPNAVAVVSETRRVVVANNLFTVKGNGNLAWVIPEQKEAIFRANAYWVEEGDFLVKWKGTDYTSPVKWGAADRGAVFVDPMLTSPGKVGSLEDRELATALEAYKLRYSSPLKARGINLAAEYGIATADGCFFGQPISNSNNWTIGAHSL